MGKETSMKIQVIFPKSFVFVFFLLMASLNTQSVQAAFISEINISPTGASYNSASGDFVINGNPATGVNVLYNDPSLNPLTITSSFLNFTYT